MPALPLSVRFALWATVAVRGEMDPDDAVVAAHPDVDDITGEPAGRLELWRDFGESAVLVALPRPGDLTGMPRAELAGSGAAATSGECVFVPGIGGLLNVTFGNAPELIIALFALGAGLHEVVKASIVGSIMGNVLLVLGKSSAEASPSLTKSPHGMFDILRDTVSEKQACWTNPAINGVR
jgi:hypothetical protein